MQNSFIDLWVGPVIPNVVQVVIEIHKSFVGPAVQERRGDPLRLWPVFAVITTR